MADAWLTGAITGGTVRDLTVGVSDVLRRSARVDTPVARSEALDLLLPVAASGGARRLASVVGELRLRIDPDGTTEEALFAFENQSLSIVEASGSMWRISGWITPESAIATRTVLEAGARQIADEQLGGVEHDPDCDQVLAPGSACSCGELDRARRAAGLRHDQLLARALGEVMTDRLDDAGLGSHHRVAPHITVVADITDAAAPPIGRLAVPGVDDEMLVGEATLDRLLCDSDVTRVLTTTPLAGGADATAAAGTATRSGARPSGGTTGSADDTGDATTDDAAKDALLDAVITTLDAMARSVLYVGRSERTVSARLRRALEVRDRHCVFPACRARVARCHAHHVLPWQRGGGTSLPNTALLCVTHHHAVHEGGWAMALRPGATGHEQGCWTFTPPEVRRRPRP